MYLIRKLQTPIGNIALIGDGRVVEYIQLGNSRLPSKYQSKMKESPGEFKKAAEELNLYFQGKLSKFTFPISLEMPGFRKRALQALAKVGYGKTISYRDLAVKTGSPNAYRAAASACSHNPLPIVIPCHRVVKSDGSLGGFGGGVPMKRKLLDLEHAKYKR